MKIKFDKQSGIRVAFIFMLCFTFLLIANYKLSSPGVQYDELLFVNAASGVNIDNTFIYKDIQGFPVLLMPYIGALKSYIYYPIFQIFGVSTSSIRLPTILITILSLIIIYLLVSKVFNWYISSFVLFLLVFDPTLIYMTRLDVGPNVLELFLKCFSLLILYQYYIRKQSANYLIVGLVLLGLGLFNKLNFIWFINALYGSVLILSIKNLINKKLNLNRRTIQSIIFISIAYLLYVSYFLYIYHFHISYSNFIVKSDNQHLKIISRNLIAIINDKLFFSYLYGSIKSTLLNSYIFYLNVIIIFIGLVSNIISNNEILKKKRKWYIIIWLILIFNVLQIFITKKATAPWHAFTIYPLFTVLYIYSIYSIALSLFEAHIKRIIFISSVVLITFVHQTIIINQYFNMLEHPTRTVIWSDKIYDLINYTIETKKKFVSIDWGLHNNLIAFNPQKNKYYPLGILRSNKDLTRNQIKFISNTFLLDTNFLYISHPDGKESFPIAKQRYYQMANDLGLTVRKEKIFSDESGDIYEILSLISDKN